MAFHFSSNTTDTSVVSTKLTNFAWNMRTLPRKALKCDVYGTTRIVVDEAYAMNIFAKVLGRRPTKAEAYVALGVIQNRLDDRN